MMRLPFLNLADSHATQKGDKDMKRLQPFFLLSLAKGIRNEIELLERLIANVCFSFFQQQQQQSTGTDSGSQRCSEHADQTQTYYCNTCRVGACHSCVLSDGRHQNHDVHLLALICKQQKVNRCSQYRH